jgi:transcription antitermination factor NusG
MFGASDDYLDSFFSAAYFNHSGGSCGKSTLAKPDENRRNVMIMSTTAGNVTKMRPHSAKLERLEVLPGRPVSVAGKVRPASASTMRAKTTTATLHLPPMNDDYVGVADEEKVKRKKKKKKKKSAVNNVLTQLDLPRFERISSQKTYRLAEAASPETTFETTFIAENPGFLHGISMRERKSKSQTDSPLHHLSYNDAFDDLLHSDGSEGEKVGTSKPAPRKSPKKSPVKQSLMSFSSPTKKCIISNSPVKKKSISEVKMRHSRLYSSVTANTDDSPPNNTNSISEVTVFVS